MRKQQSDLPTIDKILSYIAAHEGEEFDHVYVARQLHLTHKALFQYLCQLERERKIVTIQKYLRKPILITEDDYENYFWKVFLASQEHPRSDLGRMER